MRVGIVLVDLNGSGAPWNYVATLAEKLHNDSAITPVGIYSRGSPERFPESMELVAEPGGRGPRWHAIAPSHDIDLFHINALPKLGLYATMRCSRPVVATCHGTGNLHDIQRLPRRAWPSRRHRYQRTLFNRLGKYALDGVFAVSDYVRDVLCSIGYSPGDVITTYEGVDDAFYETPVTKRPDEVPDRYLLHASNCAPKKNLPVLLAALTTLDHDVDLVVTGRNWRDRLAGEVRSCGLDDRVHFPGYVPRRRLIELYDHAACFVYPSLHESFGLPNIEAMARGTPVVTTSCAAIPEIVGDAAITVDNPEDPEALTAAIDNVLGDRSRAEELATRGRTRADRFRWEEHVDTIERAYRRVRTTGR